MALALSYGAMQNDTKRFLYTENEDITILPTVVKQQAGNI
jgi:hypothetical protein